MTGFHLNDVNPHLQRYFGTIAEPPGQRVFVPLCGKSLDLTWLLRRGVAVCGVELSAIAARAVFEEAKLEFEIVRDHAGFETFRSGALEVHVGDFFEATPKLVGEISSVYDRAALIALPGVVRTDYVTQLIRITGGAKPVLLVTLEYDQAQMSGPPFAVGQTEVAALYAQNYDLRVLEAVDVLGQEAKFKERGVTRLVERVYFLSPLATR